MEFCSKVTESILSAKAYISADGCVCEKTSKGSSKKNALYIPLQMPTRTYVAKEIRKWNIWKDQKKEVDSESEKL